MHCEIQIGQIDSYSSLLFLITLFHVLRSYQRIMKGTGTGGVKPPLTQALACISPGFLTQPKELRWFMA